MQRVGSVFEDCAPNGCTEQKNNNLIFMYRGMHRPGFTNTREKVSSIIIKEYDSYNWTGKQPVSAETQKSFHLVTAGKILILLERAWG